MGKPLHPDSHRTHSIRAINRALRMLAKGCTYEEVHELTGISKHYLWRLKRTAETRGLIEVPKKEPPRRRAPRPICADIQKGGLIWRKCRWCPERYAWKPIDRFTTSKESPSGHTYECKACRAKRARMARFRAALDTPGIVRTIRPWKPDAFLAESSLSGNQFCSTTAGSDTSADAPALGHSCAPILEK